MFVLNRASNSKIVAPGVERKILATGGSLMTAEVRFEKGSKGAAHSHTHQQVSYVVSGRIAFTIEGKKEILLSGDGCYVAGNLIHEVEALEDSLIIDVFTPIREDFL